MAPTLRPGDWLLVDPDAYVGVPPDAGDLVVVPDPRLHTRMLVKRVSDHDGVGDLILTGDDPGASTDSRTFGAVDAASVHGRPWFRYWPPVRWGRVR